MQSNDWLSSLLDGTDDCGVVSEYGRVMSISGCFVEATQRSCVVGEAATIIAAGKRVDCEIVSINGSSCLLAPLRPLEGIGVGDEVEFHRELPTIDVLNDPFGKILDGFGKDISSEEERCRQSTAGTCQLSQAPLVVNQKATVTRKLDTGIRIIDDVLPLGAGQKLGIFAGSGIGKSTLLNNLYKSVDADVKIIAMVGERSREVVDFYSEYMDGEVNSTSILIASTSEDLPSLKRRAVYVALAYARHYCAMGKEVVLILDSITRLAHALREIGISRGELPVARGYPPSVFSEIPRIVEQCGNVHGQGSVTCIMSVLVDGDDENEPVSDFMRGILDGHFILDRKLSNVGLYPSINILKSRSRTMANLMTEDQLIFERKVREIYSSFSEVEDVVRSGLYQQGTNEDIDKVIAVKRRLDEELYSWKEAISMDVKHHVLKYKEST